MLNAWRLPPWLLGGCSLIFSWPVPSVLCPDSLWAFISIFTYFADTVVAHTILHRDPLIPRGTWRTLSTQGVRPTDRHILKLIQKPRQ